MTLIVLRRQNVMNEKIVWLTHSTCTGLLHQAQCRASKKRLIWLEVYMIHHTSHPSPSHLTLPQTGFARDVFVCGMYVDILKAAPSSIQTSDSLTSDTYGFLRARTAITHVFISRLLHYMYYRCSQVHWPMSPYVWCHKCCIHKDTHARQSFRFVKNVM